MLHGQKQHERIKVGLRLTGSSLAAVAGELGVSSSLGATRVPVAIFKVAGRRGRFAAAVDIAAWLWRQRGGNAQPAPSAGVTDQIEVPNGAP
jgi:hypothetical protein